MLPEGKCRYIDGQIYPDGNFFVLDTQHIKHNGSELKSALNGISTDISNKVDKETGKGLSTNDYTTAEKNKLSGIEANANNYVHPTTSGNKHIPSGGSSGKILGWSADGTAAWVDPASGGGSVDTVYIGSTEYAPDANGKVTLPTYPTTLPASDVYSWAKASTKPSYTASEVGAIATTAKGANNGVAELDSSGKVPSSQLPSYVDDVLEYSAKASFPATGETGKIYVDTSTNLTYRWSGSAYTEISPSLALGETSSTAYRGDRGKDAYNHATDSSRLTTATASGLYKVAATAQGHIASLTAVVKSDITGLGIPAQDTTYSNATTSKAGLMSSTDKTKLNGIANGANKIGYELKTVNLNSLSWTQTAVGIFYSSKVSIPNLSKIFGMTIYGFANLRYTDVITPKIYGDGNFNGISFLANTGSFHNGAVLELLVFGIST